MADKVSSDEKAKPSAREEIARRWALASEPRPDDAGGPRASLLLNEVTWVAEPIKRIFNPLVVEPAKTPKTVMLLPGFGAHPLRMRHMAQTMKEAGHVARDWGLGFNLGATAERLDAAERRLCDIHEEAGEQIVLVGWSLGGVIARELAKRQPDKVCKVMTLGSPFSGSPRANNGWRAYQVIAGHRVDEPEVDADPAAKPPAETIAFWSPLDGVVCPRSARGREGERDREVSVRCTHMGFVEAPEAVCAVLQELDND